MSRGGTQSSGVGAGRKFEFQKWPVYELALGVVQQSYALSESISKESTVGLRDQLRRASQSIPLNIAEGTSRYSKKDKANFWRVARGSVFECAAILDLVARFGIGGGNTGRLYEDLVTVAKMLSGLIRYVETSPELSNQTGQVKDKR